MTTEARGQVKVLIDEVKYEFHFNFNALCAFQKELGLKTIAQVSRAIIDPGFEELRAGIWAALLHAKKPLTLEEVGELDIFGKKNFELIHGALTTALVVCLGSDEDQGEDEDEEKGSDPPEESDKSSASEQPSDS